MSDDKRTDLEVIEDIACEIISEREDQNAQWGQQDHPSLHSENARRNFEQMSKQWHEINDARVKDGSIAWDGILLEEVYEALCELDPIKRRAELIQVAAVAAAEVECLDRKLAYVAEVTSGAESP